VQVRLTSLWDLVWGFGEPRYGSTLVDSRLRDRRRSLQKGELSVSESLDWLNATRDLKAMRHKTRTKKAFARVFGKTKQRAKALVDCTHEASYSQLRVARVRLDLTCMILFRSYAADLMKQCLPDVYLFTDGSPQWRGLEMIASSFDMVCLLILHPPIR
jgi:hypothetical protein